MRDNYNMVMHDMGEEREASPVTIEGEKPKKEIYYPTTYISSKNIPEIAEYDVGDECEKHIIARIKGKREKEIDGKVDIEVEVEILKMGIIPHGDTKKMKEMDVERNNYDKMKKKGMV